MHKNCPLFYAASENDADMLYLAGFFVADPFLAFVAGGKSYGLFNALEIGRARQESNFDEILPYEEWLVKARRKGRKQTSWVDLIRCIAKEFSITSFRIPDQFPAGLALELKAKGIKLSAAKTPFFAERETKSDSEAKEIRKGNAASAAGIRAAEKALRKAKIDKRGYLILDGKRLTSEKLRLLIDQACLEKGAIAAHTIAAGGDQACDPHCIGYGSLKANELIIVDVFPRLKSSGYYGDMTRTFLKGKASEAQKELVDAVAKAQAAAMQEIRPRKSLAAPHKAAQAVFTKLGYETRHRNGIWEGFFHGLGHGLGLEVHEEPRLSIRAKGRQKKGMVGTVEPGLYYPGLGGCRIEDVVRITKNGYEKLSNYHYRWQIR